MNKSQDVVLLIKHLRLCITFIYYLIAWFFYFSSLKIVFTFVFPPYRYIMENVWWKKIITKDDVYIYFRCNMSVQYYCFLRCFFLDFSWKIKWNFLTLLQKEYNIYDVKILQIGSFFHFILFSFFVREFFFLCRYISIKNDETIIN